MTIKEITSSDIADGSYINEMVAFGKMVHEDSGYSSVPFDGLILANQLIDAIQDDDGCVYAAIRDGKITGGLVANIVPMFFSAETEAIESIIYVHKDYHHTMDGPRLIRKYIQWAKDKGAFHIGLGHSVGFSAGFGLGEYLKQKHGFKEAGTIYTLETR